ncbi:MAG: hypothetical protein FIB08_17455 [Candidatus Methanoperedens sp.]|nr:hypothetical protein [Candidatus Methanoperedens sp.]
MKKTTTPSFITELPLRTTPVQESTILVRLDTGRQLYNACLGESLKRLGLILQSKEYQPIKKLPKMIEDKPNKARTVAFNKLNQKYGFREYDIHHYATGIRNSWINEHIGIHIAQKIATRAFHAVQKKAFGTAKNVRFKGKNQFDSLEGKNNQTGLIFQDNILYWSVSRAKQTAIGWRNPSSFGFNRNPEPERSHVKPVTSISEAMDVVIRTDGSHRELI